MTSVTFGPEWTMEEVLAAFTPVNFIGRRQIIDFQARKFAGDPEPMEHIRILFQSLTDGKGVSAPEPEIKEEFLTPLVRAMEVAAHIEFYLLQGYSMQQSVERGMALCARMGPRFALSAFEALPLTAMHWDKGEEMAQYIPRLQDHLKRYSNKPAINNRQALKH